MTGTERGAGPSVLSALGRQFEPNAIWELSDRGQTFISGFLSLSSEEWHSGWKSASPLILIKNRKPSSIRLISCHMLMSLLIYWGFAAVVYSTRRVSLGFTCLLYPIYWFDRCLHCSMSNIRPAPLRSSRWSPDEHEKNSWISWMTASICGADL